MLLSNRDADMSLDLVKMFELSEKLLEIIDKRDEYTRSDLQGIVEAFVRTHCKD
jgi:hypothetical protein